MAHQTAVMTGRGGLRRILYDATPTIWTGSITGIPRVVRTLAVSLAALAAEQNVEFGLLFFDGQRYHVVADRRVLAPMRLGGRARAAGKYANLVRVVLGRLRRRLGHAALLRRSPVWVPQEGDALLLPDAVWRYDPWTVIAAARLQGVGVHCLVHDLLPLRHPDLFEPSLIAECDRWWDRASLEATSFLCVSHATEADLRARLPSGREAAIVEVIPLGFDFEPRSLAATKAPPAAGGALQILTVGTLEPRKNHAFVLEAFEEVWRSDVEAALTIVGRRGWAVDALAQRIQSHPRYGTQLFWNDHCSDEELEALYGRADALVAASIDEGFGLPLIEAEARGVRVLASDIPVFREVADPATRFFPLDDPSGLAGLIIAQAREPHRAAPPRRALPTWRDCAAAVFDHLRRQTEHPP